ncbi:hypothetical protein [Actibacterium sp.]|uniref:hypothetical protein n=1 Tax=Actibacterium sp. TaxID=1872125 RepID=UPI00356660FE
MSELRKIAKGGEDFADLAAVKVPGNDHSYTFSDPNGGLSRTRAPSSEAQLCNAEEAPAFILNKLEHGPSVALSINSRADNIPTQIGPPRALETTFPLRILSIHSIGNAPNFRVQNLAATHIDIASGPIVLENVRALKVTVHGTVSPPKLEIRNSKIGLLQLSKNLSDMDLHVSNSTIIELRIKGAQMCRDIRLHNVTFGSEYLSGGASEKLLKSIDETVAYQLPTLDRQTFADLFSWAQGKGNSEVAHLARSTELQIEYADTRGWAKGVMWIWKTFGGFGLSPLRPISCLLGAAVLYFLVMLILGTDIGSETLTGWQSSLAVLPDSGPDDFFRAGVSTLQNVISPWNILSNRALVVPHTALGATLTFFHAIFSLGMLLFMGFSIRRRFRFI